MNIKQLNDEKLYYSIGEVSKLFDISRSLIRYWESEFENLKPHKNGKGERKFTKKNIEQLSIIYHLVKERGFTLKGAKAEIESNKDKLEKKHQALKKLNELKGFLKEISDSL
jgi:DNA-binding transcriptional MerR regulator